LTSSTSTSSLVRNLIDSIESHNSNAVLTPLQLNHNSENNSNHKHQSHSINKYSTDTDDAKIISSRVRSNSSNQESNSTSYIGKNISSLNGSSDSTTYSIYSTLPFNRNKYNSEDFPSSSCSSVYINNSDVLSNLVKQYGVSKRNALMKWCQERINEYKGVEIKNFSSSWNDGLAFCALLHSYMPNKLDYEELKRENNARKNFQTAFKVAQSIGIEQTLNIQDLLNNERPDWNAVMNYVTLIYKHFNQQKNSSNSSNDNDGKLINGGGLIKKNSRSSSSSPTSLRNLTSTSSSSVLANNTSNSILSLANSASNSSTFTSASSSSSSISKTVC
jgi:hypothetical protein